MDSVATAARLEWWANSSTCLAAFEVSVTISVGDHGWEATGELARIEEGDDLTFFCDLGDAFDLCFPDESTVAVTVTALTPTGSFALTGAQ
ncbi:hypothetical protein E1218_23035 [Kribbella turkmenica]|uniref:Uncharacterized protein n=1 Tax=Kribbella turkmenica TaxID=2530375 RepID=A0A4R4WPH1_9ACTN|nr:hypothetical protein [Kribbella turkmenica]TDD20077.1 hypothetical protein E1218_23035 [Kribbella turkmenica]